MTQEARRAHSPPGKGCRVSLRRAHKRNDGSLERLVVIGHRFRNDTERLEKLFDPYTKMAAGPAWINGSPVGNAQLEHPVRQLQTRISVLVYYPRREPEHISLLPADGQEGGREYRDSGKQAARVGQLGWRE